MTARHAETTAQVTPAYGVRPVGGFGVRGWRVHCPECRYLSRVYTGVGSCRLAAHKHRCQP